MIFFLWWRNVFTEFGFCFFTANCVLEARKSKSLKLLNFVKCKQEFRDVIQTMFNFLFGCNVKKEKKTTKRLDRDRAYFFFVGEGNIYDQRKGFCIILPPKKVEIYYFWKCTNLNRKKKRENCVTIHNADFRVAVKS